MTIQNPNGSPYQVAGSLQQFDPENPDLCLFNAMDQEIIQIGGSPIFYYSILIQTGSIDPIYREDRNKIFVNDGIQLWGYYEPMGSEFFMDAFGYDSPMDMRFEFNYRAVLQALNGEPPKIGSLLFTPHKREWWTIVAPKVSEFKLWGELRLELICKRFQDDVVTNAGRVQHKQPDFEINPASAAKCPPTNP